MRKRATAPPAAERGDDRLLTEEVAGADGDLAQLVDSSNAALGAIASQDTDVQEAVRQLGPTLEEATSAGCTP